MIKTGLSKDFVIKWIENLKLPAKLYAVLIDNKTLILYHINSETSHNSQTIQSANDKPCKHCGSPKIAHQDSCVNYEAD